MLRNTLSWRKDHEEPIRKKNALCEWKEWKVPLPAISENAIE
jgi:hypothetical protein